MICWKISKVENKSEEMEKTLDVILERCTEAEWCPYIYNWFYTQAAMIIVIL